MKRSKPKSRGADDSGALAEAELTALEADISQLQVGRHPLSILACLIYVYPESACAPAAKKLKASNASVQSSPCGPPPPDYLSHVASFVIKPCPEAACL